MEGRNRILRAHCCLSGGQQVKMTVSYTQNSMWGIAKLQTQFGIVSTVWFLINLTCLYSLWSYTLHLANNAIIVVNPLLMDTSKSYLRLTFPLKFSLTFLSFVSFSCLFYSEKVMEHCTFKILYTLCYISD